MSALIAYNEPNPQYFFYFPPPRVAAARVPDDIERNHDDAFRKHSSCTADST